MCMIVVGKRSDLRKEYLDNAFKAGNRDGFGFAMKGFVYWTLDYKEFIDYLSNGDNFEGDEKLIVHMRKKSVGPVTDENVQPFQLQDGAVFAHNGTVWDFIGHSSKSDSRVMADALNGMDEEARRLLMDLHADEVNRFVYMTPEGEIETFGEGWHEVDGAFYSNCYYKKVDKGTLVAVYGTLKQGYGNHSLLKGSRFVGRGETLMEYPMIEGYGFPYVYEEAGVGENVCVEVYEVDDETLDRLDILEGNPTHYYREMVHVWMNDDTIVEAWMYFANHDRDPSEPLIACWEK